MLRDKKGSMAFVYFMIGIVFFLLGLALAPALSETIQGDEVRGSDGLDCSNATISNQDKGVCYQLDAMTPLYVGLMFGFAGIIIARLIG